MEQMRDWFKYEYGYVNIDHSNLFLTNTGNWSETEKLTEKTNQSKLKNDFKKIKMYVFLLIAGILFSIVFFVNLAGDHIRVFLIILPIFAAYRLYKYTQHNIGSAYKIPLEKINQITIENNNAVILFNDGNNISTEEKLIKIEEKGIKLLTQLKELNKI